ncbi:MAG: type II CAAX endopeptidase family protein [Bacillota bacterium]|nr:type II CAAX endopeptidase family protein [Bacillota bacterium]
MIKTGVPFRLIIGILFAHLLMYFSFNNMTIFWYIFAGSILLLIMYTMSQEKVDDEVPFFSYFSLGILSGIILYVIFWLFNKGINFFNLPFSQNIYQLYHNYAPSLFWEYLALIFVAAPGEELFWRGYIQKQLLKNFQPTSAIILGALLYASAQIYSGQFILVFATFICGIVWGSLYHWKKSMPVVIVSHILFDILLFIFLPLR